MRFTISLFLDRFKGAEVIMHKVDGKDVKGVFIPFRQNRVYNSRYGFLTYMYAMEIDKSRNGNTHFVRQYVPKSQLDAVKRGDGDRPATIGYMKPTEPAKRSRNFGLAGDGHFDAMLADGATDSTDNE